MSGQADATAMLAVVSRVLFSHELRRPPGENGLHFKVDGVRIEAVPNGPRAIRLNCTVAEELPDRESELRALMAKYLRYCDTGNDVLCADSQGRLLLIAEAKAGDDVPSLVASFCDAAVYWTKMAARRQQKFEPLRGPMMIFP